MTAAARAHEVLPTIADLTVADGTADMSMRINLEAFLAGIDLDAVADTNEAENAGSYDSLRALSPDQIAGRVPELLARWNDLPLVRADGTPVRLDLVSVRRSTRWVNYQPGREFPIWFCAPKHHRQHAALWLHGLPGPGRWSCANKGWKTPIPDIWKAERKAPRLPFGRAAGSRPRCRPLRPIFRSDSTTFCQRGWTISFLCWGCSFSATHLRPLIWQVSAFTAAHTVTLALGGAWLGNRCPPASWSR